MKPWKRIEPTKTIKVGHRVIVEKTFELPDGYIYDITTMWPEDMAAAATLALTPDNKVVVVRMFRGGPELIMDELPGGQVDKGETPEQAAQRELREETGYEAGEIRYLGECHYDAYANGHRHCFLATNCVRVGDPENLARDEQPEVRVITIEELLIVAKEGRMTDPGVVLLAYDELQKRRGQ